MSEADQAMDVDIALLCRKHGLGGHAEQIANIRKLALEIALHPSSMDEMAPGESRFGGIPDLPTTSKGQHWRGTYWPEIDGLPLDFLAQFDIAQLRAYGSCSQLPATGYLLFFYGLDNRWSRYRSPAVVLYSKEAAFHRPSEDWEMPDTKIHRPCKLSFKESLKLPHPGSSAIASLGMCQEEIDRYDSIYRAWSDSRPKYGRSHLFGYPFIFNCPENPDWDPPKEIAEKKGSQGWQLLIQIAGSEEAQMRIGDLGLLNYFVHTDDLAVADFSQCWTAMETT